MTNTTNTWLGKPGVPLNPEKDDWHWVKIIHGISQPRPRLWWSKIDRWELSDGALISPSEFAERWRYIGPCLTPDEVQNLRDDLASAERERAHQHGRADQNAAEYAREQGKRDALQKRVPKLETALQFQHGRAERAQDRADRSAAEHAREQVNRETAQARVAELEKQNDMLRHATDKLRAMFTELNARHEPLQRAFITAVELLNDAALEGGKKDE